MSVFPGVTQAEFLAATPDPHGPSAPVAQAPAPISSGPQALASAAGVAALDDLPTATEPAGTVTGPAAPFTPTAAGPYYSSQALPAASGEADATAGHPAGLSWKSIAQGFLLPMLPPARPSISASTRKTITNAIGALFGPIASSTVGDLLTPQPDSCQTVFDGSCWFHTPDFGLALTAVTAPIGGGGRAAAEEGGALSRLARGASDLCGGQSFAAGTAVLMADGTSKPIDQIKPGDKVQATDPTTGKTQPQAVTNVWVNHDTDLLDLTVEADGARTVIHTTEKHPFWDGTTHTWTNADHLTPGDHLHTDNGAQATVIATATLPGSGALWDLTIAKTHDFYILATSAGILRGESARQGRTGDSGTAVGVGILVHNCGGAVEDLLRPGGVLIGKAGTSESIRELSGGLSEAQSMFAQLSEGGRVVAQNAKLIRVELPDGGFVQLRTVMSNSPGTEATIDINIPGIDITKLKFNP
jgi:hypothetical protein